VTESRAQKASEERDSVRPGYRDQERAGGPGAGRGGDQRCRRQPGGGDVHRRRRPGRAAHPRSVRRSREASAGDLPSRREPRARGRRRRRRGSAGRPRRSDAERGARRHRPRSGLRGDTKPPRVRRGRSGRFEGRARPGMTLASSRCRSGLADPRVTAVTTVRPRAPPRRGPLLAELVLARRPPGTSARRLGLLLLRARPLPTLRESRQ
jgi:hypothetical protein